jgi:ketosteroid isomerase-like protein
VKTPHDDLHAVAQFEPAFLKAVIVQRAARSDPEVITARSVCALLAAIASGGKTMYQELFTPDASVRVVGVDRRRVITLPTGSSMTETLFPDGFRIEVVRAALNGYVGFVEARLEGLVRPTGKMYSTPLCLRVVVEESGLIVDYMEFPDAEKLYAASTPG